MNTNTDGVSAMSAKLSAENLTLKQKQTAGYSIPLTASKVARQGERK